MKGKYVPRKAGWDTHGLPVELEVEKLLGLNGKEQMFYESAVTSEMVIGTIGVSLFAGILSLVLGYVYFKHDDLN